MDPEEFLSLAQSLAEKDTESATRTSVSRCYYAALLKASALLEKISGPFSQGYTFHDEVGEAVHSTIGSGAFSKLSTLRGYRSDADYQISVDLPEWCLLRSLKLAGEVIRILEEKM